MDALRGLLAVAMLRGDREAVSRLQAAGAKQPVLTDAPTFGADFATSMAKMADSVNKVVPTIHVPDLARSELRHGFIRESRTHAEHARKPGPHDVSLWFYTDQVDRLYQLLKSGSSKPRNPR